MANGSPSQSLRRPIHPLVLYDYRMRIVSHLVITPSMALLLHEHYAGWIAWTCLGLHALLWPHVAFLQARFARDAPRAERGNVLVDAFLGGCWIAFIGFTPLPTTMLLCALIPEFLSLGGVSFTLMATPIMAAGTFVTGALVGLRFQPETTMATTVVSGLGLLFFMGASALASRRQIRRIIQSNRTIEAQKAEIQAKTTALEAASRHKSEFLASMSHELRTPLNAVLGFSEVLLERMFGDLNEKQEEYLKDIAASGAHLLSLINEILDLSKIEAGRMELELADFYLRETIGGALILMRERAARRGVALGHAVDGDLGLVRGDERKIKQVLLNLLSNALKFTPEGGRVDVRARVADGAAEVSVTDTGVGIAPEDQQVVFEEFRQVGGAEKKLEGTGLGLALSQKFVELHGGRIWVTSELGVGSTFTFTLPLRS